MKPFQVNNLAISEEKNKYVESYNPQQYYKFCISGINVHAEVKMLRLHYKV